MGELGKRIKTGKISAGNVFFYPKKVKKNKILN